MSKPFATKYGGNDWERDTTETSRLLSDSIRIAQDTEAIGENTASDLIAQGEILHKTRSFLDSMIDIGDSARESIQTIRDKANRKKFVLKAIIVILFAANITVIYLRSQNGGSLWPAKEPERI